MRTRREKWIFSEIAAGTLPATSLPPPRYCRSCGGKVNIHGACVLQRARRMPARLHSAPARLTELRKQPWALRSFVDSNVFKIGRTPTRLVRCEASEMSCLNLLSGVYVPPDFRPGGPPWSAPNVRDESPPECESLPCPRRCCRRCRTLAAR